MNAPNGLVNTYDRSGTNVCTVQQTYSTSTYAKAVYTPVDTTNRRVRYYDDYRDTSNYDRWQYDYATGGQDMTRAYRPGGVTLATYTYNSQGRFSTAQQGGGRVPPTGLPPTAWTPPGGRGPTASTRPLRMTPRINC